MGLEDAIAKLAAQKPVKAVFLLEGEFYREVVEEEGSITESFAGMPLVNRALEEVVKRTTALCVFCENAFDIPHGHVMVMEDLYGNVVGHDVPPRLMERYRDDPDVFWFCDDFAMYPNRARSRELVMVMLPQDMGLVGKDEGVKDAILLYPATTTDILMKKHFGTVTNNPKLASAIVAFDLL